MPRVRKIGQAARFRLREALHDDVVAGGVPWSEAVGRARDALSMPQATFAEKFGLAKSLLVAIEQGTANPTVGTLMLVARRFGFEVGFIHPRSHPRDPWPERRKRLLVEAEEAERRRAKDDDEDL